MHAVRKLKRAQILLAADAGASDEDIAISDDRMQLTLLPNSLEDYVSEENPVRVIEVFIDELDLTALGFAGMTPAATGRPAYHPSTLLKIYLYGYLNRIQSSRRLEREAQRNIELMWSVGRLAPDFKTIADFRKDQPTLHGAFVIRGGLNRP
jgi:transposase